MGMNETTIEEKKKIVEAVLPNVKVLGELEKKRRYLKCYCELHKHSWEAYYPNLKKGHGCPKCKGEKIGNALRLELEEVLEEYKKRGLIPLFKEYKNGKEKLPCETAEGYKVMIDLNHLKRGRIPTIFGNGNPFTIENIKLFLKNNANDYKLLSTEFKSACKDKLMWECEKGHNFEMSWNSIQGGRRCPKCFKKFLKTTNEFKKEVHERVKEEYSILGEYKRDNIHIEMKHNICGHKYKVTPSHFLQGKRCPKCAIRYGEKNNKYNPNLTVEDRIKRRIQVGESVNKWRNDVFQRDNFTCQCCKTRGVFLQAHHLDGYNWCKEKRFDIANGVTLCKSCHTDFHKEYGYGNNTKEQFEEFASKSLV